MSYTLELQIEAIFDIQDAFQWYELHTHGLGFDFIEELETGFNVICNHPQHYTAINEHFRRLKIKRFPYLIIYEIEALKVIVNSVRHTSRKPKF